MWIYSVFPACYLISSTTNLLNEETKAPNGNPRLPICKLEIELAAGCGGTHLKLQTQDAETGGSEVQG